jgi:hypothetical protein
MGFIFSPLEEIFHYRLRISLNSSKVEQEESQAPSDLELMMVSKY